VIKKNVVRYAFIGALVGLMIPIVGTIIDLLLIRQLPLTLDNFVIAQVTNPIHWIIDTAPFMLGMFAAFAGSRQDQVEKLNQVLTEQLDESLLAAEALESTRSSLETEVADRTADILRRAQFLEAAASVGQAATSIYNLDELLPQVTKLIAEQFGFYHAGIFLLDEAGRYAVLRAANSEGGQKMLARAHQLKVGEEGIVGFVSGTGEARVALDVGADATHFDNPDLPETRSEMGLPLYFGGRLFGVLNVQSREENAFSDEDVAALGVLADQVAMAINNARLFDQLQQSVDTERKAFGEIGLEAWKILISKRENIGYRFDGSTVLSTSGNWNRERDTTGKQITSPEDMDGNKLTIPIQIRGKSIGVLNLKKDDSDQGWTEEEKELIEELSEQLGLTLDSARLYEETQLKAMNEKIVSDISTRSRETLDIESILKTAAEEVRKSLNLPEVSLRLAPNSSGDMPNSQNGQSDTEEDHD
jgi:GAF domain-containing protein